MTNVNLHNALRKGVFARLTKLVRSVHPLRFCWRERVEPLTEFSKREGLIGTQLSEGSCWERGGDVFQGGRGGVCDFQITNTLKSQIFNDKKFKSKNIFLS